MRPLSVQFFPARHRIGPAAWSLLEPSQRSHLLSFMKVQAIRELRSEPRAPSTAATQRSPRRPGGRGLQGREPVVSAQVAAVVSLVEAPANHRMATTVAKEAMAIKYGNTTGHSIKKFLEAPVAGKHPKPMRKGTKAAVAEAAVTAAEAIAVAD